LTLMIPSSQGPAAQTSVPVAAMFFDTYIVAS
jgi:hypothetical protein